MALHKLDAKRAERAIREGKAKTERKPLRSGQRHRTRSRKPRIVTTFTEAGELQERADKIEQLKLDLRGKAAN